MTYQEAMLRFALLERGAVPQRIELRHASAETVADGRIYPLVWPRLWYAFAKSFARAERPVEASFQGLVTAARRKTLAEIPGARIVDTKRGRRASVKFQPDEEYLSLLGSSRYVLCPPGDFAWTYRFFEAVACGAMPVVWRHAPQYDGYEYATPATLEFSSRAIEANRERFERRQLLPA